MACYAYGMNSGHREVSKGRGAVLLALVGLAATIVVVVVGLRVQRSLAPGADNQLPDTSKGVPELDAQVIASGLNHVWDVGFLSDDTPIFTERAGTISKLDQGQKVVLATVPNVQAVGEGGLMGLAVDPDFAENRYIYACYNTPEDIRVSRWKVNPDVTALTEQTDIVTGMPVNTSTFSGRHSGCRPRFGAEGYLWIATGDVAIGTNPQDPQSLGGKVLRVDRDGQAAPDNLGGPFDPRIFSYGHRNVQGLAMFDEVRDGAYGYSVEHGPSVDDEVNLLQPGNFGWDPKPGYNESVPMTDTTKYPDAVEAVWSSGDSTIAPSGATIITGSKWGAMEGWLAIAVLKDNQLLALAFDSIDNPTSQDILFEDEFGRLRSAVIGPSNNMYLTTDNGNNQDQIIQVSPKQS